MGVNMEEESQNVVIGFVIPQGKTEITVTQTLALAYDKGKEAGLDVMWIKEQDVLNIKPTKADVVVLDPFSGPGFNHLRKFSCSVIGPSVLLAGLATNSPVPQLPYPVYTTAMRGLIITTSGMEQTEKKRIKKMVERMAGIHSNAFHDGVTHLVASTTRSQKYEVAVEKEIPCMLAKWVEDVWKVSSLELVTAVDPRFRVHRCPPLLGVTVCVSQLNKADRDLLKRSVETYGGVYSGVLEMETTTVLICTSPEGEKYNHAKKWNIPCVSSQWVFDSIEKGICLQTNKYRVDKRSSKHESQQIKDQSLNTSSCVSTGQVNETMNCSSIELAVNTSMKGKRTGEWLAELELGKVKKAGSFLDGCKVFLSGFTPSAETQLARVLKYSGAVRLAQLVESVTHCVHSVDTITVVPETNRLLEELDLSPHMVSIQWVVESLVQGKPVPESDYPFPPMLESEGTSVQENLLKENCKDLTGPALLEPDNSGQFEASLLAEYGM